MEVCYGLESSPKILNLVVSEAAIPTVPIDVKKPANTKDTPIAARKTTMTPYINAVNFETSGLLTIFNTFHFLQC